MKRFLWTFIVICSFICTQSAAAFTGQIFSPEKSGAAFLISTDGHLLSQSSLVDNYLELDFCFYQNSEMICGEEVELIAQNDDLDLALLKIKNNSKKRQYLDIDVTEQTYGAELYLMNTIEGQVSILQGTLNEWLKNKKFFQLDIPINNNYAGGAVLNSQGQLVGIAIGNESDLENNMGWVIPYSKIQAWLKSIPYEDANLYGTNRKELENQIKIFAEQIKTYQKKGQGQAGAERTLLAKYDQKREILEEKCEENLEELREWIIDNKKTLLDLKLRQATENDRDKIKIRADRIEDLEDELLDKEDNLKDYEDDLKTELKNDLRKIDREELLERVQKRLPNYNAQIAQIQIVIKALRVKIKEMHKVQLDNVDTKEVKNPCGKNAHYSRVSNTCACNKGYIKNEGNCQLP